MIVLDICLSDITASARREAKNKKIYTNIVVDKMRQPDQYGNTHTVFMSQSKEDRQAGREKVYIGKAKEIIFEGSGSATRNSDLGF